MITIKYLEENVPDLIDKESIRMEGKFIVIDIIHGRIKIMPKDRKPK